MTEQQHRDEPRSDVGEPQADAARLQDMVLGHEQAAEFLSELADMAAQRCSRPGLRVECGITVIRRRRHTVVASSGQRARALDELQNRNGDGPCLSALRSGSPLLVQDLHHDERWPGYTPVAVAQGVRSILAVPLALEGEALAVLNLYADRPQAFSPADVESVKAFADIAARSLKLALVVAQLREARSDLTRAMRSRTTIDMAIGAIMAQNRCPKKEAFDFLMRASNSRNIKLRDVAAEVIQSISGEGAVSTHFDE